MIKFFHPKCEYLLVFFDFYDIKQSILGLGLLPRQKDTFECVSLGFRDIFDVHFHYFLTFYEPKQLIFKNNWQINR